MTAPVVSRAPGAEPVADPLVLVLPGQRRFVAGLRDVEVEPLASARSFPNGELVAEVPAHVHGRSCVVVGSVAPPPGAVERLTVVTHALRRAGAREVLALLPYLAYARQDCADPAQSLGLGWLGGLLRACGVDALACVDVHSDRAAELLDMPVTSLSPAHVLAAALPPAWLEDVTFVAPDEGAIDRCNALALAARAPGPIAWLRKRRSRAGVTHLGLEGTVGRRALVVDDILDTGGTLVSCCEELRRAGVEEVALVVTHGLFTGSAWEALPGLGVAEAWIADTVLSRRRPAACHVVPVAPLVAALLRA